MTVTNIDDARASTRKLTVSTGTSRHAKKAKQSRLTWPMFVEKMRDPVRTKERFAEYLKLPKSEQDQIKDVGWFVGGRLRDGVRKKDHLETRDLVTLDIDFAGSNWDFDLDEAFGEYAFACYTTHKHSDNSPRLRLVFPLTRSATPDEYPAIARMVASWWDVEVFDDTTYQSSRVMYWPSCSVDGEFEFVENGGRYLDPDAVLGQYDDWTDVASWPVSIRQGKAIETRVEKAADPLQKKGVIGDFCRAYTVPEVIEAFLSDIYVPGSNEERYSYTGGSTSNGAIVYNDGRFLYSNHGTDPAGGRSVNAFDLVRLHLYSEQDNDVDEDVSPSKRPSYKAMIERVNRDDKVAEARVEGMFDDWDDEPETETGGVETTGTAQRETDAEFTDHDQAQLKALDRGEDSKIKNHVSNTIEILRHDKRLKKAIAWNEFQQDFVQVRDLPSFPVRDKTNGDLWQDKQDSFLVAYIHKRYDIEVPAGRLVNALNMIGGENKFHPVRDYLDALTWDGKPRLDSILIDHLQAEDTPYTRAVTRKTFAAAVARVYEPGAKFDNLLILEGAQGVGKSSFLRDIARGWFTDSVGSLGKDSVENLKGKWIAEIGELTQFKKAEVEHIKAFLSRQVDRIREAYARRATDFPRQSVCIGTTNDDDYLKDAENRRFWPVKCHAKTFVGVMDPDDIAQMWAEAVTVYRAGEPLDLTDRGVADEAREQQKARQADQDTIADLGHWLNTSDDDGFDEDVDEPVKREFVSVQEIWAGFFAGRGRPGNAERAQIRKLMKMSPGWSDETKPRRVDGVPVRVYTRL